MFGVLIYDILFSVIPAGALVFFGISLVRYLDAKRQNKQAPDTFSPEDIRRRLISLIVSSVILGVLAAVVIGFIALMFMAVAFM